MFNMTCQPNVHVCRCTLFLIHPFIYTMKFSLWNFCIHFFLNLLTFFDTCTHTQIQMKPTSFLGLCGIDSNIYFILYLFLRIRYTNAFTRQLKAFIRIVCAKRCIYVFGCVPFSSLIRK